MKTAITTSKIALIVALITVIPTAAASVQGNPSADLQEGTMPSALIIVNMLPAEQQSEVPQSIAKSASVNKTTDSSRTDFVHFRIEPVVSSILTKRPVCATNRDWKLATKLGNRIAIEFVADNQFGFFVP